MPYFACATIKALTLATVTLSVIRIFLPFSFLLLSRTAYLAGFIMIGLYLPSFLSGLPILCVLSRFFMTRVSVHYVTKSFDSDTINLLSPSYHEEGDSSDESIAPSRRHLALRTYFFP